MLAAVRLLPAGRMRAIAVAGTVLTGLMLLLSGVYLAVPVVIALAGFAAKATDAVRARHNHPGRQGAGSPAPLPVPQRHPVGLR